MKKSLLILLAGLALAVGAFAGFYYLGTASSRGLMREPEPELAWLKREFHLNDAEYERVVKLHEAYLPQCAKRCQVIEQLNQHLAHLLAQTNTVTPEIQAVLLERAKVRATCESEMLQHFLTVSRTMPSEQGRRYLLWVEQQTFMNGQGMEQRHHPGHVHPMSHASEP